MERKLTSYGPMSQLPDKDAVDYREKLSVWAAEDSKSERELWDALCEVIYAAHNTLMERSAGYAVDHAQCDKLDRAIDAILEAMPGYGKAKFDALMQK